MAPSAFRCSRHGKVEPRWFDGLPFCPICERCECGAVKVTIQGQWVCARDGCAHREEQRYTQRWSVEFDDQDRPPWSPRPTR